MGNKRFGGLSAGAKYYYNVSSCDVAGNCNTSSQYSFTTTSSSTPSGGGGPSPAEDQETDGTTVTTTTIAPTTTAPPPPQAVPEVPEKKGICGPTAVLLLAMLFPVLSRIRRKSR